MLHARAFAAVIVLSPALAAADTGRFGASGGVAGFAGVSITLRR